MNEFQFRAQRPRITRRTLWFVLVGVIVIIFDIATINWTLTLPQGLGNPLWSSIFTIGVMLIVLSTYLARVAPGPPSKIHAEQIDQWERSHDITVKVSSVSKDETLRIMGFTRQHFGKYVLKTVTTPSGKTWTVKKFRIGSKVVPTQRNEKGLLFDVILYRRDLAKQKGIRKPWRTFTPEGTLELVKSGDPVELPNWITD